MEKRKVEFVELRRERPHLTDSEAKTHFFMNCSEADIKKVSKDTLYMVVADIYGLSYIFDVTKPMRKNTSGKTWTPKFLTNMSASLERKELFLGDDGELKDIDKILKKAAADMGY